jgi:hypothetical protein
VFILAIQNVGAVAIAGDQLRVCSSLPPSVEGDHVLGALLVDPVDPRLVPTGVGLRHGPGALHVRLGKLRPVPALQVLSQVLGSDRAIWAGLNLSVSVNPSPFAPITPPTPIASETNQ